MCDCGLTVCNCYTSWNWYPNTYTGYKDYGYWVPSPPVETIHYYYPYTYIPWYEPYYDYRSPPWWPACKKCGRPLYKWNGNQYIYDAACPCYCRPRLKPKPKPLPKPVAKKKSNKDW